jgi:hypothetical protein
MPDLASLAQLRQVAMVAEVVVVASGGSPEEANVIAEELVAYVDFNWLTLHLDVLALDPEAWERHLVVETLRRWLAKLCGVRPRTTRPSMESRARAKVLELVDEARLDPEDRYLFDNVYVHGFSVADTAKMFRMDQLELVRRLRLVWASVRRLAHLTQP